MDENVNSPESVNQPAESATATSQDSDVNQTNQQPNAAPEANQPEGQQPGATGNNVEANLNRALRQEREQRRALQRQIAEMRGQQQQPAQNPEELGELLNHPVVQSLLERQATYELKEGVGDLLSEFPNTPKYIADQIRRNPRGFVKPTTTDVQNALLDIRDYLEELSEGESNAESGPQPKAVPIVGNNQVGSAPTQDVNIQELLKKAPEELTSDEVKKLSDYQQRLSVKRG